MIRSILKRTKLVFSKIRLKLRFLRKKSFIGKIISCSNVKKIEIGKSVRIKDYCRLECIDYWNGKKLNSQLKIGTGVIINDFFTVYVTDHCTIGNNTIFANRCTILTENHGMNPETSIPYHAQDLINGPVHIGKNCWIGTNVTFLPNSSVGDNVIVAAHSVVNKSFPSNVIIAGAPAKIIKEYNFKTHQWEKIK